MWILPPTVTELFLNVKLNIFSMTRILFRKGQIFVIFSQETPVRRRKKKKKKDRQIERRTMAALIDFSCNLLTNSSPDISLSLFPLSFH